MAVKDAQEVTDLNQDVEIIRDILFGKHLQKLSNQLNVLEEAVASLKQALDTEIKSRKEEGQSKGDQINEVQHQVSQEIKDFNQQFGKQIKNESQATQKSFDGLRKEIDKQLQHLQGETDSQRAQLSNLINTLAGALADYQKQNPGSEPNAD